MSFKPLYVLLRIRKHPSQFKAHISLLTNRNGPRQKSGVNIEGICVNWWYRLLTHFELYPCITRVIYALFPGIHPSVNGFNITTFTPKLYRTKNGL